MPHYVASDVGLYCLPMSHKKDARLIWIKLVQCLCPSIWHKLLIYDIFLPPQAGSYDMHHRTCAKPRLIHLHALRFFLNPKCWRNNFKSPHHLTFWAHSMDPGHGTYTILVYRRAVKHIWLRFVKLSWRTDGHADRDDLIFLYEQLYKNKMTCTPSSLTGSGLTTA